MKRIFLVLGIVLATIAPAMAQEATPLPSPTPVDPLVQRLGTDSVFMTCRDKHLNAVKDQEGRNPADVFFQIGDMENYFNCVNGKHDYNAVIVVGQTLLPLERAHKSYQSYAFESGDMNYDMAVAYYKLGQKAKAKQYAEAGYAQIEPVYKAICSDVPGTCRNIRALVIQIDKSASKRYANEDAAEKIRATKQWDHEMAGVSEDMQRVSLMEAGEPCHKQIYDHGDNYHQVTWWYCDANGHYRKAYTFLNGNLQSTYTP